MQSRSIVAILALAVPLAVPTRAQSPLGTELMYQGRLTFQSAAANGLHDFQFSLFDDAVDGIQVGPTICADDVDVSNGLFTVVLDFGPEFDGQRRFLEVAVRKDSTTGNCDSGVYTTLSPRQEVLAAPYAQTALAALSVTGIDGHSLDAADGDPADAVFVSAAGNVGVGTTRPFARLHVDGGHMRLTAEGFDPVFELQSDGLRDATTVRLKSLHTLGLAVTDESNNVRFLVGTGGDVGIGTISPEAPVHVLSGSAGNVTAHADASIVLERNADDFLNFLAPDASASGLLFGQPARGNAVAGVLFNTPAAPLGLTLRTNGADRLTIDSAGNVGIGTPAPTEPLHIVDSLFSRVLLDRTGGSQVVASAEGSAGQIGTFNSFPFRLLTNNTVRMTVDPEGDIGIGTTSTTAKLVIDQSGTDPILDVRDSGASVLRVVDGGNVGIGTTSPTARLTINQSQATTILDVKDSGSTVLIVKDGGNVGIGTSSPTGKLHVSGSSGDGAVVLPSDSVSPAETSAEAGLASRIVDNTSTLPRDSTFTLAARAITCPTDGFVVAIGTVEFIGDPTFEKAAIIGILTRDDDLPSNQDYLVKIKSFETTTVQSIRAVSAGSTTFFFQTMAFDDNIVVEQRKMSLLFFPTAYGTPDTD